MTPTVPDASHLTYDQCLALRQKIDERIDTLRDLIISQAASLGLELREAGTVGKRRKKRRVRDHTADAPAANGADAEIN